MGRSAEGVKAGGRTWKKILYTKRTHGWVELIIAASADAGCERGAKFCLFADFGYFCAGVYSNVRWEIFDCDLRQQSFVCTYV